MRGIIKQFGKRVRAHDDKDQLQGMQDIIEADGAIVGVFILHAEGISRTKISLMLPVAKAAIGAIERFLCARDVVELATTKLKSVGVVVPDAFRVNPDARTPETGLEALNADDGEQ